jgi:hypothetical protein
MPVSLQIALAAEIPDLENVINCKCKLASILVGVRTPTELNVKGNLIIFKTLVEIVPVDITTGI